jgi:hypothetical protein
MCLRELDFGRCDDAAARRAERRKLDAGRAPASVEERATERRLPGHVPDEVEGRGIDLPILSDRDSLAFPARKDRLERHVAFEHPVAACVDITCGHADLGVRVRGEVLKDEVDEPTFALQQGEHLDGTIRGIRSDGLRRRLGVSGRLERSGQAAFEEDREERRERQLDPSPHSHRTLRWLIVTRGRQGAKLTVKRSELASMHTATRWSLSP